MLQYTENTERGTDWLINTVFPNPESFEDYLEASGGGEYEITDAGIFATPEAVAAAEEMYLEDRG